MSLGSRKPTVQNKVFLCIAILTAVAFAFAAAPGEKRTILTSGNKVYTVHYQLGQSTVFHLGFRPDTVICGNENYFHIEKLKDGLTVQPLSNISTNLDIKNLGTDGQWGLFFLTPAKDGHVDAFIDVRWVPESEAHEIAHVAANSKESAIDLNQKLTLGVLNLQLKREITIQSVGRTILEFSIKNNGKDLVRTSEMQVTAIKSNLPLEHQISVFEQDELKPGTTVTGRLIVTGSDLHGASFVLNYASKGAKLQLPGGKH